MAADQSTSKKSGFAAMSDVVVRDQKARVANEDARRALNSLAVTSHLVGALIRYPGPMGERNTTVQAAKAMIKSLDDTTASLVSDLSLQNIQWAKPRLMRMVSNAVADRWRASAKRGSASADVSDLLPVWKELSKLDADTPVFEDPPEEDHIALQISLLDAMIPVVREIQVFDLFHDPKKAATYARDHILKSTDDVLKRILGAEASDTSRKQMRAALLRHAGNLYSAAWRRHAENLLVHLNKLSKSEQLDAVDRNPGGFPLDQIDTAFEESFTKLVEMVEFLTPLRTASAATEEVAEAAALAEMEMSAAGSVSFGGAPEGPPTDGPDVAGTAKQ